MALEGSLHDMSLVDLLQFLRMRAKTGVLLISSRGERGAIAIRAGQPAGATLARVAEQHAIAAGEQALARMLQWQEGTFMFQPDQGSQRRAATPTDDGQWLLDQSRRALPASPITLDSQVQLAALPASAESGIKLDLDQWRILSQVAAARDVRAICEAAGLPPARALATLAGLAAIGLVELLPPADAPPGGRLAAEPAYDLLAALLRRFRGPGEP